MLTIREIFSVLFDVCVTPVSLSGHMFILVVNALDAAKSRRLPLNDWLICSISVFSILYTLLNIFESVFFLLQPIEICAEAANKGFLVLFLTIYSCNIWFSTWLCVYFCLKIVKFNQRFYIYLQKIFPKLFTWILLLTVIQAFLSSFISVWTNSGELSLNATFSKSDHEQSLKRYARYAPRIIIYSATFSISYGILYTSALTIIFFLYKHMKKMKNNTQGPRSTPKFGATAQAIKTILALLAINTVNFLGGLYWFMLNISKTYQYVSMIFTAIRNVLLPLVLIKVNCKLNKALQKLFQDLFSPR